MIARHWRGIAQESKAAAYVAHLRTETFPLLSRMPGFLGASILRREVPAGVEFLVITTWESLDAIRAFAGPGTDTAVVPPVVRAMMVDFEPVARHYEVLP